MRRHVPSRTRAGGFRGFDRRATLTGQSGKLPTLHTWDLLPYGQRIRGVNIALGNPANATVPATLSAPHPWARLWKDWDEPQLQHRLDLAVQLGANTVRMPGTVVGVRDGHLTRADYLAKWAEFSGWCQERNLFLYPYLADYYNEGQALTNASALTTECVAAAAHLDTLPDIVGIDIVQEADYWIGGRTGAAPDGPGAALSLSLYNAVKAVTDLPLTYSRIVSVNPGVYLYGDRTDFADCHVYDSLKATPLDLTDAFDVYARTAPVVLGEYGVHPSTGSAAQITRGQLVLALHNAVAGTGARLAGSIRWAVEDYDTDPANQHGLIGLDGAEKATETTQFRTISKA